MKPIIAVSFAGIFVDDQAWRQAHSAWFAKAAQALDDADLLKWIDQHNYFIGVDEIMLRLHPDLNPADRTELAREQFFDAVCSYIERNPSTKNKQVVKLFAGLKRDARIIAVTTNTPLAMRRLLTAVGMETFFDDIVCSQEYEKDDRHIVLDRLIETYKKPAVLVSTDRIKHVDFCIAKNIPLVIANLDSDDTNATDLRNEDHTPGVYNAHTLEELEHNIRKWL